MKTLDQLYAQFVLAGARGAQNGSFGAELKDEVIARHPFLPSLRTANLIIVLGGFLGRGRKDVAIALTLEVAVRNMSSDPAARLGFKDHGMIARGNKADIVLFDPSQISDQFTFEDR